MHLHPKSVDKRAIVFSRTFGLGGVSALLFVILAISGTLLRFAYVPSEKGAYDSILLLQNQLVFGQILRNIHYWSAMLMLVTTFLHFLRVFYSQSLYFERRKNWFLGLALLFLVIFSNFTGYLLPWDQLSFWAVTIMTNMVEYIPLFGEDIAAIIRSGPIVSEKTLLLYFTLHTSLLPLLFIVIMSLHFWQIRKAKGVTVSQKREKKMIPTNPNLIWKEISVALSVVVILLVVSVFFDAPLLEKANPAITPNPSKAPWYFMGFQELLIHIHPFFGSIIIPLAILVFLCWLPYFKYKKLNVGEWFSSKNGKKITIYSSVFSLSLTIILVLLSREIESSFFSDLPQIVGNGFLPLLYFIVPTTLFLIIIKKLFKATKIELHISIFTIIFTAYLTMTFIGILFRCENMELCF